MIANNDTHSSKQTLVIAGSYSEYLNWRKNNPSVTHCKYVERMEDVRGVNGFFANIILYGNYENNPVYNTVSMRDLLAEMASPFRSYVH
jgi:hypothetical protein